jgi:predicted RNA-binding Zn ribbon-like protein
MNLCDGQLMPEHYTTIDGLVVPARLGGHPALDFCNTWAGWDGLEEKEYLTSYDHLATWAGFVELLDPARVKALGTQAASHPRPAARALIDAHEARKRVYRALSDPSDSTAITQLAPDIRKTTDHLVLCAHGDGDRARFEIDAAAGLATPLLAALWSAAQLLVSRDRARIRVCPGPGCGWLFLDRAGRRRWCTMATCGNRAKARRFANRSRSDASQSASRIGASTGPSVRAASATI